MSLKDWTSSSTVPRDEELRMHDIDKTHSRIREDYPNISGLFEDLDLYNLKYGDREKRFDFNHPIVQIMNTQYVGKGHHWLTVVKKPDTPFQIYDSEKEPPSEDIPYLPAVKLWSLSKTSQRTFSVMNTSWRPTKYYGKIWPPQCAGCDQRIRRKEEEVFLCPICRHVYHMRCQKAFLRDETWPMCEDCKDSGDINEATTQQYIDTLATNYFTSIESNGCVKYFNRFIGTEHEQHPYVVVDVGTSEIKLLDCSAIHYQGIYSLAHDIEAALVHLSWPNISFCQEIEIVAAKQQETDSTDCGVYACLYAKNWALGYGADPLQGLSQTDVRKHLSDYLSKRKSPIPIPKITLDVSCQAQHCFMPESVPNEVDMYICYFCKNWYHHACTSPPYWRYNTPYRVSCNECSDIWSSMEQLSTGTATTKEPPDSDTQQVLPGNTISTESANYAMGVSLAADEDKPSSSLGSSDKDQDYVEKAVQ